MSTEAEQKERFAMVRRLSRQGHIQAVVGEREDLALTEGGGTNRHITQRDNSLPFPFVHGTASGTYGFDVNAEGEYARGYGGVPRQANEVTAIVIRGRAATANGINKVAADIDIQGGKAGEVYNAHSYSADDVVSDGIPDNSGNALLEWTVTDSAVCGPAGLKPGDTFVCNVWGAPRTDVTPSFLKYDNNGVISDMANAFDDDTETDYTMVAFVALEDAIYVGYSTKFHTVVVDIGATVQDLASALTVQCSDGEGGWLACVLDADGTDVGGDSMKQDGVIEFTPHADWLPDTVDEEADMYWLKLTWDGNWTANVLITEIDVGTAQATDVHYQGFHLQYK
jgi:hypothetical protein